MCLSPIDALQSNAQKFLGKNISVADVTSLVMKQEWFWNEDMYNQTIRITDVGYVMDPEAFVAGLTRTLLYRTIKKAFSKPTAT